MIHVRLKIEYKPSDDEGGSKKDDDGDEGHATSPGYAGTGMALWWTSPMWRKIMYK